MNVRRLLTILMMVFMCAMGAEAQGWLGRLKDKAVDAAKRTVENNVERKTERAVDDAMNPDESKSKKSKKSSSDDADYEDAEVTGQDEPEATVGSVKNDFVRGGVVMFEDNVQGEQVGEFPSKWDLLNGNAEVATINGQTCIAMDCSGGCLITPLVKDGIKNYLGDVFTVEYDMLYKNRNDISGVGADLDIMNENMPQGRSLFKIDYNYYYKTTSVNCNYTRPTADDYDTREGHSSANDCATIYDGRWHHFALSFNKRAIKFYVDGKRVINVPNAKSGAGWLTIEASGGDGDRVVYLRNVVIAKGAVELYQRQETDIDAKVAAVEKAIQETGKFVTNNILFETGKATLKPESMEEIQKVAEYMKKNPAARFEVQGHTDNQGSDAINDPLSQQRAEAVVKALESLGCDPFNLRPVGKGSHEPVADNKTDEGRAKNRRVEFIKK